MYIIKLDGEVVSVTNTFDSAALYADGIRSVGRRIAITLATPAELRPALRTLAQRTGPAWGQAPRATVTA